MNFNSEYDSRKKYIDTLVERETNALKSPSEVLLSSLKYSIATGGKRLRAILALEFFEHFGGKMDGSVELFVTAIEFLHLYTLIHDDLPCMDNDDYRRGKPSNHKVFGETMALLCGDGLLNLAYELFFKGGVLAADKNRFINACAVFSAYAGINGVIGGQALEFETDRVQNETNAMEIYRHKTCDLICAAVVSGAVLAGAKEKEIDLVRKFGYHFGIAFQVRDDLLDIQEKGFIEKSSLVGLIGEENANSILEQNISAALACLDRLEIEKNGFIRELTEFAAKRLV